MNPNKFINGTVTFIIELLTNALRDRKKARIVSLVLSIAFLIGIAFTLFFFKGNLKDYQIAAGLITMVISLMVFSASLFAFSKEPVNFRNQLDIELEKLSVERAELKAKVVQSESEEIKDKNNVFNTIQLNLNQTTEYYTINKSQAKQSFRASIFAIVIGLITLVVGIWFMFSKENITMATISAISSVLLEAIGGMYFYVYKKSLEQLNFFYDKLEKTQDTMVAIELTNNISDDAKKMELQEKVILNLIERSSNTK
ncbi:TRADD-N-associated membrane domain-containing protein [Bacillus mycoides]|uniref:TRADD-N-associated membrane domain-containing protein n=1 Tax=Bacillus mycoides TaxID=1405 RepID=UPI003D65A13F